MVYGTCPTDSRLDLVVIFSFLYVLPKQSGSGCVHTGWSTFTFWFDHAKLSKDEQLDLKFFFIRNKILFFFDLLQLTFLNFLERY